MRFIPEAASTFASEVDWVTGGLLLVSAAIMGLVALLVFIFVIRYWRGFRPVAERTRTFMALELGWTIIPLILAIGLSSWSAVVFYKMRVPPPGATDIYVVGKQWMWKFQHADGRQELNELHVPIGTPIRLLMTSQDVIHSFYVPEFRVKQDLLPGRYSETWFEATKPGEFHLLCAEFCGTSHSRMRGKVIVLDKEAFSRWKASAIGQQAPGGGGMVTEGQRLFMRLGCVSCHGTGSTIQAPSLTGLYGARVGLRTGQTVVADENYLRESILRPTAKVVQGFQPVMPSFQGQISESELNSLIAYLKSLKFHEGMTRGADGTPK